MDNKQYSTRELFRRFAPYFKNTVLPCGWICSVQH